MSSPSLKLGIFLGWPTNFHLSTCSSNFVFTRRISGVISSPSNRGGSFLQEQRGGVNLAEITVLSHPMHRVTSECAMPRCRHLQQVEGQGGRLKQPVAQDPIHMAQRTNYC